MWSNDTLMMNASNVTQDISLWDAADTVYNRMEWLFSLFYLVKPSRTFHQEIDDTPNFISLAFPAIPLFILMESILMWKQQAKTYNWQDSLVALGTVAMGMTPLILMEKLEFTAYIEIYKRYHIIDLPCDSMLVYVLCLLTIDFSFYWVHRIYHEVSFLWAFHEAHHTSEYFNAFAGLRISVFTRYLAAVFDIPLAFVFPPGVFYAHHSLNYAYMFWLHTETIPGFGFLDYIINNPSLHAVHHGRNRYCIDKNYGSIFSIWDVMFGTFQRPKKDEKIYYGQVHTVKSWDLPKNQLNHLSVIKKRLSEGEGLEYKLSVLFKGPGWMPGTSRLGDLEQIPEVPTDTEPYNKPSAKWVYWYLLVHVLSTIVLFAVTLKLKAILSLPFRTALLVYLMWGILDIGYVLEHKWYAVPLELGRCFFFLLLDWFVTPPGVIGSIFVYLRYLHLVSAVILTFRRMHTLDDKETKIE